LTKEAQERLNIILSDNGGCEFPCLWGITPGETYWDFTEVFLGSFQKIDADSQGFYENGAWPIYGTSLTFIDSQNRAIVSDLRITVGNEIVQRLNLYVETDSGNDMNAYWSYYSIQRIFSWLGQPDKIRFDMFSHNGEHYPHYDILLLYQEPKIVVWFFGERNGNNMICPQIQENGQVDYMRISIANPESPIDIFPLDWEFWSLREDKESLTTEDVFGITADDFYNQALSDSRLCLLAKTKP
jgi:hypothetical protein